MLFFHYFFSIFDFICSQILSRANSANFSGFFSKKGIMNWINTAIMRDNTSIFSSFVSLNHQFTTHWPKTVRRPKIVHDQTNFPTLNFVLDIFTSKWWSTNPAKNPAIKYLIFPRITSRVSIFKKIRCKKRNYTKNR